MEVAPRGDVLVGVKPASVAEFDLAHPHEPTGKVRPEEVDDDTATVLSHQIARDLEQELEYAGQIKVTVIRESRAVDYAK